MDNKEKFVPPTSYNFCRLQELSISKKLFAVLYNNHTCR